MTIKEAIEKKISKLRLPIWNEFAYIELNLLDNGFCGPWVKLHDVSGDTQILVSALNDEDRFEAYVK